MLYFKIYENTDGFSGTITALNNPGFGINEKRTVFPISLNKRYIVMPARSVKEDPIRYLTRLFKSGV
jgi:hypothetical protein